MTARRAWAWPLVPLYAVGLQVKDGLRAAGLLRTRRLTWPVVSVGSLSAGGAGKTPVVIALAELLKGRGWVVDVLSRGYGREGNGVELVDAQGMGAAARFGDEPVVIARRADVPVWVGVERYAAGVAAEAFVASEREAGFSAALRNDKQENGQQREAGSSVRLQNDMQENRRQSGAGSSAALHPVEPNPLAGDPGLRNDTPGSPAQTATHPSANDAEGWATRVCGGMDGGVGGTTSVHLLDDGFQHRGLRREVDVVLVTAEDLQDALLPAGNLREPLAALARANAVVVRDEEWEQVTPRVCGLMRSGAPIWRVRRELRSAEKIARPIAFCAIARPEGFFAMLRAAGCELVETVAFGDHYKYYMADMERMVTTARERGASGFLTTEKDWVKLSREMVVKLESVGPLCAVALDAKFVNEADVASDLEALLK